MHIKKFNEEYNNHLYEKISEEEAKKEMNENDMLPFNSTELNIVKYFIPGGNDYNIRRRENDTILSYKSLNNVSIHLRKLSNDTYLIHKLKQHVMDIHYLCTGYKGLLDYLKTDFS